MSHQDNDLERQRSTPDEVSDALHLSCLDARERLVDALARAGFQRTDPTHSVGATDPIEATDQVADHDHVENLNAAAALETWRGALTFHPLQQQDLPPRTTVVQISVPPQYPFQAPKIHPLTKAAAVQATGRMLTGYHEPGFGWHRDLDHAMCLYIEADHTRLPWADGQALLDHARAWLAHDAAGWPADAPALDLDRYLHSSQDRHLVLYGSLGEHDQQVLRLQSAAHDIRRVGKPVASQRRGRRGGHRQRSDKTVLVLDAGQLTGPIRDWNDLLLAVGPQRAERLTRELRAGLRHVLLSYRRDGARSDVQGVLALELKPRLDGSAAIYTLRAAPDDLATRQVRAHLQAPILADRKVAVVGVGAVGSVIADLLHRSGVGILHLRDHDLVLPGNTTRHLLGEDAIGSPKARAVAEVLHTTRPHFMRPSFDLQRLKSLDQAVELLGAFDLVIDATADSTATALLSAAARAGAGQLLSACVLADGYAVRVDRIPTRSGEDSLPLPDLPPAPTTIYETGCGSPVSTTPPAAVWEAAALAARHAITLLLTPSAVPAGEQRLLRPEVPL